jgi:ERF superfamily
VSDGTLTPEQKLYAKLFEARKAAEPVKKEGESEQGYFFARFEHVLDEADKRLQEQAVLIVPQVVSEELKFSRNGFAIATVVMEFDVVDTKDGGKITRRWSGTGHDEPGDKALFKAQTGCEKYFLAKLLGIPFGTDPEADASPDTPPETAEARRVRLAQDRAAEAPQAAPSDSLAEELESSTVVGVG